MKEKVESWRTQTACTGCRKEPLDGWIEKNGNKFCSNWCAKQYYGSKKWGIPFGEYRSEKYSAYLYKNKLTQTFPFCLKHGIKNRNCEFCPQCGNKLVHKTITGIGKIDFDQKLKIFTEELQGMQENTEPTYNECNYTIITAEYSFGGKDYKRAFKVFFDNENEDDFIKKSRLLWRAIERERLIYTYRKG